MLYIPVQCICIFQYEKVLKDRYSTPIHRLSKLVQDENTTPATPASLP